MRKVMRAVHRGHRTTRDVTHNNIPARLLLRRDVLNEMLVKRRVVHAHVKYNSIFCSRQNIFR